MMLENDPLTYYILDEDKQVQSVKLGEYKNWLEHHIRDSRIAKDLVNGKVVSTVFLLSTLDDDHFETKTFHDAGNGKLGRDVAELWAFDRYETYEDAMRGHERIVERVKGES